MFVPGIVECSPRITFKGPTRHFFVPFMLLSDTPRAIDGRRKPEAGCSGGVGGNGCGGYVSRRRANSLARSLTRGDGIDSIPPSRLPPLVPYSPHALCLLILSKTPVVLS